MGRLQESVQEVQRARELAPLDWIVNISLCERCTSARRYEEALAQCKANLDLDPSSPIPHKQLGAVYCQLKGWTPKPLWISTISRAERRLPNDDRSTQDRRERLWAKGLLEGLAPV